MQMVIGVRSATVLIVMGSMCPWRRVGGRLRVKMGRGVRPRFSNVPPK